MLDLGHKMSNIAKVNESTQSEDVSDREILIKIANQIEAIFRLQENRLEPDKVGAETQSKLLFAGEGNEHVDEHVRQKRRMSAPSMPDSRRLRRILQHRQKRAKFFPDELFADPAWDMLLDLAAAQVEGVRVSVTSLCIASGVPPTTALRWISMMVEQGLLVRKEDVLDKRRSFIALSDKSAMAMARYFTDVGSNFDLL